MKRDCQRLPDSELNIMLALWQGHSKMSRSEIELIVNEKKAFAPTTILSLLTRLEKKGFVSVEKQGNINLYTPLVSQEVYQHRESKNILEKLYGNSLKNFVASLYQGNSEISEEEMKALNEYIEKLEAHEE